MTGSSYFSIDYFEARARFRGAADARGFRLEALPIGAPGPGGEVLTIDAAVLGSEAPERVVIVSGGLHGVEGPFGSAVQQALLEEALGDFEPPPGAAVVLLHALNPWGYTWGRRFDDQNVDLNRNFLRDGEAYRGSPPAYAALDDLLNPRRPPEFEPWLAPIVLGTILRRGFRSLKEAVAGGQYDFPRGLFYGGAGPAAVHRRLAENLPRWVGDAERIVHVDFHTGLGRWGAYKLLVDEVDPAEVDRLAADFGPGVEGSDPAGISYRTRGSLGPWCRATFPGRSYDLLLAEFGAYPILPTLRALRAENQAYHWGEPDDPRSQRARRRLLEVFVPADAGWRNAVVPRGLAIVRRAIEVAFAPGPVLRGGGPAR